MKKNYIPEGIEIHTAANQNALESLPALRQAMAEGVILEAVCASCTPEHNLIVPLPCGTGVIARDEGALGIAEGQTRDIAILSRVGKPVCFKVLGIDESQSPPLIRLSRLAAQQDAQAHFLTNLRCGDVIGARVTHMEPFGVFVDIGCGVTALIGIENLSVSRIFHPSERFCIGQDIRAAVLSIDQRLRRITLSHRELLGTWEENAALFSPGETVQGTVRSVESYGIFIELTPNLSGLAERKEGIEPGQQVSVYIKSILPERMKIKLSVIDRLSAERLPPLPPQYFIKEGHLQTWVYTPECCHAKFIATEFGA